MTWFIAGFIVGYASTWAVIEIIRKTISRYKTWKFNRASCPDCESTNLVFYGLVSNSHLLICMDCKRVFNLLEV